jgi:hypothetical protein
LRLLDSLAPWTKRLPRYHPEGMKGRAGPGRQQKQRIHINLYDQVTRMAGCNLKIKIEGQA